MIRPLDAVSSIWKTEQQAQSAKDPGSAPLQNQQKAEIVSEAEARDNQVMESDESGTDDKVKSRKEGRSGGGSGKKGGNPRNSRSGAEEEETPRGGRDGLDFYA
ncbi:hypothetical protein [Aminiphilus circumscriptus]|jgi:hypothetical protein|uniref:hypothetical protein n=1 Tax=Aminiphilus circumscriptus TaxID=290732 RepID=UPI0004923AD9|nr:hypothetical protein [Aminiphilus circumscriptus]